MFTFDPFAIPWAVVALMLFGLAGVIYARQKASRVAVLFCATSSTSTAATTRRRATFRRAR